MIRALKVVLIALGLIEIFLGLSYGFSPIRARPLSGSSCVGRDPLLQSTSYDAKIFLSLI